MKGVILSIAPDVPIVDISHVVPPQDVESGGRLLAEVAPYFPANTIHVAVIDPGVGTSRLPIAVKSRHGTYVGPDNGIFSAALVKQGVLDLGSGKLLDAEVVELREARYRLSEVSSTFHGRDIFAPAAAHLALGAPLAEFGPSLSQIVCLTLSVPDREGDAVRGHVVHVDHFGNLITDIPANLLPPDPSLEIGHTSVSGLNSSYQEAEVVAIVGSHGFLEIAVRNQSAEKALTVGLGTEVTVRERS